MLELALEQLVTVRSQLALGADEAVERLARHAQPRKGEARHTLSRAVAFHRLGRFRDRSHERQSHRAAALNLVTACIGLFNCRYLDRTVADLRRRGAVIDEQRLRRLSPLRWDHINLTGDYVWSESATYDADGLRPLNSEPEIVAS